MTSQIFAPFVAAIALALAPAMAAAQEAAPPAAETAAPPAEQTPAAAQAVPESLAPAAACCTVPARTTVEIEFVDRVNSKLSRSRDTFAIRLAEPLTVDGRVLVPAGTPGMGEVVHASKSGIGGKAGELILAVRYLDFGGSRLPLRSLRYGRSQGRDDSGAVGVGNMVAAAVLPIASVVGFLIQGGEVDIPAGTRAHAQTATELVLAPAE